MQTSERLEVRMSRPREITRNEKRREEKRREEKRREEKRREEKRREEKRREEKRREEKRREEKRREEKRREEKRREEKRREEKRRQRHSVHGGHARQYQHCSASACQSTAHLVHSQLQAALPDDQGDRLCPQPRPAQGGAADTLRAAA
jgi:hypothetical protein